MIDGCCNQADQRTPGKLACDKTRRVTNGSKSQQVALVPGKGRKPIVVSRGGKILLHCGRERRLELDRPRYRAW